MTVDEKTKEALDLKNLKLPTHPPVLKIEWEDYEDSTGDAALRLLVIFAEDTDLDNLTGRQLGDLKRAIRDSLLAHGIEKFPYISISTPEELAEPIDEDD